MPQWKQYSGIWTSTQQAQARAAETWTGLPFDAGLWAWGSGVRGETGFNDEVDRSSPVQVGSLDGWSDVYNVTHTVAVKNNGLYVWGSNTYGQLGLNDTVFRSSPVQVGALTNWATVSCSSNFTAAIKTDGTLWVWGLGGGGRLGQNNTIAYSSPVQVGSLTNWSQVTTIAVAMAAIKTDGTLWAWGANSNGTLGQNNVIARSSPVQVGVLTNWKVVSGDKDEAWFASKTDGTLWFCGYGQNGGSGTGLELIKYSSPVQIGALTTWDTPATVICSNYFGMAIKTNGTLWAWGRNTYGQLGTNNTVYRSSPVQVGSDTGWTQASIGNDSTGAIRDGKLYMWGYNFNGEVGQNNRTGYSSPVQVRPDLNWSKVSAGTESILALEIGKTTT